MEYSEDHMTQQAVDIVVEATSSTTLDLFVSELCFA